MSTESALVVCFPQSFSLSDKKDPEYCCFELNPLHLLKHLLVRPKSNRKNKDGGQGRQGASVEDRRAVGAVVADRDVRFDEVALRLELVRRTKEGRRC
jgi:hypothetical protein